MQLATECVVLADLRQRFVLDGTGRRDRGEGDDAE
jgi:hypothetical protein